MNELVINGADDTDTVDFTVTVTSAPAGEGSRWALTVTAKPQPGVVFREGTTTEWSYAGTVNCSRVSATSNPPVSATSNPPVSATPNPPVSPTRNPPISVTSTSSASVAQSPPVPVPAGTHPETGSEHVITLLIGTVLIGAGLAAMRLSRRDDLADAPSG